MCLKETECSIVLEGWGDPDPGALPISAQSFSREFPIGAVSHCTSQRRGGGASPLINSPSMFGRILYSPSDYASFLCTNHVSSRFCIHVSCLFLSVSFSSLHPPKHIPFRCPLFLHMLALVTAIVILYFCYLPFHQSAHHCISFCLH